MRISSEFTITIKLEDILFSNTATDEEIRNKITLIGRERINAYLRGYLIDPNKKVIFEEITYKEKESE